MFSLSPSGNKFNDVTQYTQGVEPAWRSEVLGSPYRIKPLLVTAQAFEIAEVFALAVHEPTDAVPQGWQGMSLEL